jgi:predicted DNA binding CopG/RHH family protein
MTSKKKPIFNLDKDEKSLSVSFEQGEWRSVKNLNKEKVKAQKAAQEGLPYQTLIASVLHKYAAGHTMRF